MRVTEIPGIPRQNPAKTGKAIGPTPGAPESCVLLRGPPYRHRRLLVRLARLSPHCQPSPAQPSAANAWTCVDGITAIARPEAVCISLVELLLAPLPEASNNCTALSCASRLGGAASSISVPRLGGGAASKASSTRPHAAMPALSQRGYGRMTGWMGGRMSGWHGWIDE